MVLLIEFFAFLPVIVFFVFIIVIVGMRKKALSEQGKNEQKDTADELLSTHRLQAEKPTYVFCPACNTKIDVRKARKCHICKTDYICPKCHRCCNIDQHHGM